MTELDGLARAGEYERETLRACRTLNKDLGYNPTRWLQMINEHGAVEATRRLLRGADTSEGFARLWEAHRLGMSVEWYVLAYADLFMDEEREIAARRLERHDVPVREWLRDRLDRRWP